MNKGYLFLASIFLFSFSIIHSQNTKLKFINSNSLLLSVSDYNIINKDTIISKYGGGVNIHSVYGIFFLNHFSSQIGLGVYKNIGKNYTTYPYVLNFKYFLNNFLDVKNSPYLLFEYSENVKFIKSNFKGEFNRFGVGYIESINDTSYLSLEIYKELNNTSFTTNDKYSSKSYGISIALSFIP